jgi:biotin synthase
MTESKVVLTIEKLIAGEAVSLAELVDILACEDAESLSGLHRAADQKRREMVGDAVLLRGIIEIANVCGQNCHYCGLRRDNRRVHRYRMPEDEIVDAAKMIAAARISTVVLQSGEDQQAAEEICALVERIKRETGLIITLSLGDRSYEDFRCFREAGADRYLLKHETASKSLFETLRPGSSYENRRLCLQWLKQLGFDTGAGNLIGLPGQSPADLAADLLYLKALQPEMIGIGPFIPHPETPLRDAASGSKAMTLKVVALARLLVPHANLPATTALGVLDKGGRTGALRAGANVVMLDFTPEKYRRHYEIYPGKTQVVTEMDDYLAKLRQDLAAINRPIG